MQLGTIVVSEVKEDIIMSKTVKTIMPLIIMSVLSVFLCGYMLLWDWANLPVNFLSLIVCYFAAWTTLKAFFKMLDKILKLD